MKDGTIAIVEEEAELVRLAETDAETRTNSKKPAVHGTNARITRGVRYLKTGWWCVQSDTNRSPVAIPC